MAKLPQQLERLARMLTYILGHRPDEFGLVLSTEGFILVKQLLQALAAEPGWGFVRRYHLDQVVGLMSPPALEIDGDRIRSLNPPELRRAGDTPPPALLYAAIPPKAQARVWEQGLKPPPSGEVLLAGDKEVALKLGRRRSPTPVLVTVQAQAAARRGISFTGYGEGLYLAPALDRDLLQLPPPPPAPDRPAPETPRAGPPTPGSFFPDLAGLGRPPAKLKGKGKKDEPTWKTGARALRKQRSKGGPDSGGKGGKGSGGKGDKGKGRKR